MYASTARGFVLCLYGLLISLLPTGIIAYAIPICNIPSQIFPTKIPPHLKLFHPLPRLTYCNSQPERRTQMTTPNMQKMQQLVEQELLASYGSLYRLAFTYVKNEADAMDIVQESA